MKMMMKMMTMIQVFERVISELEVWCVAEQDFCVKFFNLLDNGFPDDQKPQLPDSEGPWVQNQKPPRSGRSG